MASQADAPPAVAAGPSGVAAAGPSGGGQPAEVGVAWPSGVAKGASTRKWPEATAHLEDDGDEEDAELREILAHHRQRKKRHGTSPPWWSLVRPVGKTNEEG